MPNRGDTFGDWLEEQLQVQGWRQAELARRVGVTRSTINALVKHARMPSTDVCVRIAHVLRVPPEDVLRLAGHLPPRAAQLEDLSLRQLVQVARQLTEADRAELLEIAFLKLRRQDRAGASPAPTPADNATPA